jgi:uncharacterized repeat protein (TIGR01451 family)
MSQRTVAAQHPERRRQPASRLVRLAAAAAVLLCVRPAVVRAQAADTAVYVVSGTTLSVVTNRNTGVIATVTTALNFATSAIARDPSTKRVYYLSNGATPGRVAYYDPATGTSTTVNATGTGGDLIVKLTFVGGVMYGIGDLAHGSILYSITTSGVITPLGAVHVGTAAGELFPDNGDLAVDPNTGILYANANRPLGANGTSLYTLDLTTRIATHVGVIAANVTQAALTFANGTLYSGGTAGTFYRVNTATGAGTLVANTGVSYSDFTTGPPVADLQIVTMTASAAFAVGTAETYTIAVRNNGPYTASGITLVDTLPVGLQYTGSTGALWTCSAALQIVTCTRSGTLASGASAANLVLNVTVLATVAPSITNVAVVSGTLDDQNLANNRATVTTAVTVRSVAVTPDAATITRLPSNGTNYTQLFVVANTGSLTGTYNVAATVAPAGIVTIVSVNGVAGTTGSTAALAALTGTSTVTVVYSVATGAATGASAKITLTATSTGGAPVATDAGDLTVTVARAGLSMAKQLYRDDQATLVAGGVATGEYVQYRVTVTSTGGADATTVSVADNIPAQVTYVATTGDAAGWTFAPAAPSPTLTATLAGVMSSGSSRYFWIRVRVK